MKRTDSMQTADEEFGQKVDDFGLIIPTEDDRADQEDEQVQQTGIAEIIALHAGEEDEDKSWSFTRRGLKNFVESFYFDGLAAIFIMLNAFFVIIEADASAECKSRGDERCEGADQFWLQAVSAVCLAIFCGEICIRFYVAREAYFKVPWNLFDLAIVLVGIICEIAGNLFEFLVYIRVLRIVRLFRTIRILVAFRELYIIMHGMISTIRAIFWAFVLMACLLAMWSVFAVEVLHDYNLKMPYDTAECPRCRLAFGSTWQAGVTLFQTVVIGDDWGQILIPLVDRYPLTSLVFLGLHFTVAIGLVNLILAVIVDKAAEAREEDAKAIASMRENRQKHAKRSLLKLCFEMDVDKSGSLTFDELMEGFIHSAGFRTVLDVLDVDKEDLECVFRIMDQDRSGDVSYCEFVDLLYRMKTQNSKTLLMFIKHYVLELRSDVAYQLDLLKGDIMTNIKRNHDDTVELRKTMTFVKSQKTGVFESERSSPLDSTLEEVEFRVGDKSSSENVVDAVNFSSKDTDETSVEMVSGAHVKLPGAVGSTSEQDGDAGKVSDETSSSQRKARPRRGRSQYLRKRGSRESQSTPVQEETQAREEHPNVQASELAEKKALHADLGAQAEDTRRMLDMQAPSTDILPRPVAAPPGGLLVGTPALTEKWSLRDELDRLAQDIEVQLAAAAQRAEQQHAVLLQSLYAAAAVAAEGAGSSLPAGATIGSTANVIASAANVIGSTGSSTGGSAEAAYSEELSGEEDTAERLWNMAYPSPTDPT